MCWSFLFLNNHCWHYGDYYLIDVKHGKFSWKDEVYDIECCKCGKVQKEVPSSFVSQI